MDSIQHAPLGVDDEPVTLAECRPGPFWFDGSLGFKTEYGAAQPVGPTNIPGDKARFTISNWPDAYCMDSGEFFWGGTKTHEERAKLLVWPIELAPNTTAQGDEALVERVREDLRGDYTNRGMEDAFFRWPFIERAIRAALKSGSAKP